MSKHTLEHSTFSAVLNHQDTPIVAPPADLDRRRFILGGTIAVAAGMVGAVAEEAKEASVDAAEKAKVSDGFIVVDGVRYAYRRFLQPGGAPPILLLHHPDRPEDREVPLGKES